MQHRKWSNSARASVDNPERYVGTTVDCIRSIQYFNMQFFSGQSFVIVVVVVVTQS